MKIAANLSLLFTELPLAERVLAARVAGFDGVEIQFPYELPAVLLKGLLERADLPLILINLPAGDLMSGGPGLAAVPERQEASTRRCRRRPPMRRWSARPSSTCCQVGWPKASSARRRWRRSNATCGRPPRRSTFSVSVCSARRSTRWICRAF